MQRNKKDRGRKRGEREEEMEKKNKKSGEANSWQDIGQIGLSGTEKVCSKHIIGTCDC